MILDLSHINSGENISFENKCGSISILPNELKINKTGATYRFSNINFIELKQEKKTVNPGLLFSSAILLCGLLLYGYYIAAYGLLFLVAVSILFVFFLKKPRSPYHLKIVFSDPATVYVSLSKKELGDARNFISYFNRYKSKYPDFD